MKLLIFTHITLLSSTELIIHYLQIQKVIMALGDFEQVNCHACIGGTSVKNDIHVLETSPPHVIVGTPGRVYDMINRKFLGMLYASSC